MSELPAQLIAERDQALAHWRPDFKEPDTLHAAHLECQYGAPFVTTVCKLACGWDEEVKTNRPEDCQECWESTHCPLCGEKLRTPENRTPPQN